MSKYKHLMKKAALIRRDIVDIVYRSSAGHIGGSLSETDILVALYYEVMRIDPENPGWADRDRFILSKGHSIDAYYCVLADRGFFDRKELLTYSQFGSKLIGHPNRQIPGVEMNTGALGHGLSIGVGMALAAKMDKKDYRVFVLMGDGELAEGSVWEAAMAASNYRLDNLVAIIDRNGLQISGKTEEVMAIEPLGEKWKSFGWNVSVIDGHDFSSICSALSEDRKVRNMPSLVIAETVKGKGISFMENEPKWHHGVMTPEEYKKACEELDRLLEVL
ncbi:MAG: transketolase [Clostridiaceae bacterium]|nr:transketolase [Clostridiaceae bacterium]